MVVDFEVFHSEIPRDDGWKGVVVGVEAVAEAAVEAGEVVQFDLGR